MSALDTLISQASPSGGKVAGPTTGPAPAPSYGASSIDSLLKASAPSASTQKNLFPTASTPTKPASPATPVTPPITPPTKPSVLANVSTKVANAIDRPDASTLGTDANANTLKFLPSAIVESLPFGLGAAFKQIHDMEQDDPETAQYIDTSPTALASKLPGAVKDAAVGFVKAPIQGATDVAGLIKAPFAKGNQGIKFNIPGLGEISNAQYKTAARVAAGEDPVQVALEEGSGAILDTLFFASLASKPFQGRPTTTASTEIPAERYNIPEDVISENGPKSFRLYEPKTSATLLPPEFIDKVQAKGADLGENFDPKLPTYFKMTFDPANGGTFRGDVVQIRPSYFDTIKNYFGTTSDPSYQYVVKNIGTSGHDLDRAIEAGDMPMEKVYQSPDGKLQPEYAQHVVSDLAGKLDEYKPGIGAQFKESVDLTNPTPTSLDAQAKAFLDKNITGRGDINTIPVPTPAQIASAPKGDVTVLNSKVVKGTDIQKATSALKGKGPTIPLDLDNLINSSKPSAPAKAPATTPLDNLVQNAKAPIASNPTGTEPAPETVATPAQNPALPIAPNVSRETSPSIAIPKAPEISAPNIPESPEPTVPANLTKSVLPTQNTYDKVTTGPALPEKGAEPLKKKKGFSEEKLKIQVSREAPREVTPIGHAEIAGHKVFAHINEYKDTVVTDRRTGLAIGKSRFKNAAQAIADVKQQLISHFGSEAALKKAIEDGHAKSEQVNNLEPKTQKESVAESVKGTPKSIKQIAEETKILEPNVRRILGVGAKEGTFQRVEKGVYTLSKDGEDMAYIQAGDAVDSLPKLASEGFKADMVFLDIPYKTSAVMGGNRGVNYNLLTVDQFGKVLDAVSKIVRNPDAPVIHMYSQAESGMKEMQKYNDLFLEKGFKPVGKGEYQKTYKSGAPVAFPTAKGSMVTKPEGILVFTKSGNLQKDLKNLNFKLVRPSGYQTEKPAEMLKQMIEMTTEEGDTVLDPFAGSGVTGAEAVKAGRKAYLIEKDAEVAKNVTTPRVKSALESVTKKPTFSEVQKEANDSTEAAMTKGTINKYWREVLEPKLKKGEALVVGADDLKDYFGKDYDLKNHARYSKAASELFKKAIDESPSDTVKFTVGGAGSGKSDFLVPDASENFKGVVYDSTGYKYEEGLKNQIEYAESKGKKVEIYAIIPDIIKSRAYTHLREINGEHPVTESAFVRTHVGAIETMIKAIKDGQDVFVLDTRGDFTPADIESDKIKFMHNPLAKLEALQYNESHVKESIKSITPENAKEIISGRKSGTENLPKENGSNEVKIPDVSHIKTPESLPNKESSITLKAELIPGVSEFVKQDVIPKAKGTMEGVKAVYDQLATLFNPVGRAPTAGTDIIMKAKGTFEKEIFRMEQATKDIKKMWDKQPEPARFDFMSKVEGGTELTKENFRGFEALAEMYRKRLDNAHAAISKYKDVPFIENFFPHFWEKPDTITKNAVAQMMAKRPFQGTRSFLKQRVFATIQDGVDLGYKPVSTNPEELVQLYEANVKKFVMAQTIKADMVEKGLWKFVRSGTDAPEDFAKIDDSIAKVYFPQELPGGKTTLAQSGEYYAQKDVARIINNYLSKDRIMDTALGQGLMNFKNTLNAFQLGFSAFHFTMETIDSIVQKASIGLSQISQGKLIKGFGNLATSVTAPYQYFRDGQKFYNGDPTLAHIEDALFTGGASLRQKQYYKNTALDTFFKSVREGNYIGALIRAPMATIEATMRPLFSYYIPRLKVGAFRQLYSEELLRNAKRIANGDLTQEKVARDVWNNVENRMGELNYDNLFWHRNLKAGMMLTFRAVGWNLGTVREIGGGLLQDPFEQFKSKQGREDFKKYGYNFTPKMQYTLALFTMMATFGAIYQYLHTGKKPSGVKDLFYPKNGTKTASGDDGRVEFPSYLKDLYQATHSPIKTVGNKLAPEISALIDVITNKDYYGDYIRNPNDNLSKQAKQLATFLGTQFIPFTVQNIQQQKKGKAGVEQNIESLLGIINAPREVVQSEYEKQLSELYTEQRGATGPKTPEQKAIADAKTKAREAIQKGDYSELQKLVNDGIITPRGMRTFIINAQKTTAQRMYTQLSGARKAQLPPAK